MNRRIISSLHVRRIYRDCDILRFIVIEDTYRILLLSEGIYMTEGRLN